MSDSESSSEENATKIYAELTVKRVPNYEASEFAFILSQQNLSNDLKKNSQEQLLEIIKDEKMSSYYKYLCDTYLKDSLQFDNSFYQSLVNENEIELKKLNDELEKCKENDEGELEQAQCLIKLGEYYAQIGDQSNAEIFLNQAMDKAISSGVKIDIMLTITRLGFFYNNQSFVKEKLDQLNILIEKGGGDWERRNRFKTYLGIHSLAIRDFTQAAELLVDSLSTFTSNELTSYKNIAIYACVAGLLTLERTDLKQKIVDSPEILSLLTDSNKLSSLFSLTLSLYTSDYASIFPYLLETYENVFLPCKYLYCHADYFVREIRRKTYAQLLESYKTISLASMANAFGVSENWLDDDLCKFIPNKQLDCTIDRVNGIIETRRKDNKNAQFGALIKQGDGLLTKLQKYNAQVKLMSERTTQ